MLSSTPHNFNLASLFFRCIYFSNQKQLIIITGTYWEDPANIKHFFDDFAAKRKFDPLVASNWYSVKLVEVLNQLVWVSTMCCIILTLV